MQLAPSAALVTVLAVRERALDFVQLVVQLEHIHIAVAELSTVTGWRWPYAE